MLYTGTSIYESAPYTINIYMQLVHLLSEAEEKYVSSLK